MDSISAPLKCKVAIITGGSRGIGASIAHTFARHGCTHIAITYTSQKAKAEEVLRSIAEVNSKIKTCAIAADLVEGDIGDKVVDQALKDLAVDRIDILVSNAAIVDQGSMSLVADMTKSQWDKMITGNAWAPFSLARCALQHMPSGGRIIFISSGASKFPGGDPYISYSASKAALDTISRNLAVAWGVKYGVTVNSISVGPTATDAMKDAFETGGPAFEDMISNVTLLKRIAQPQEVADIVAFVASPGASWITGNQIPANGGALSALQS